jgi:hypothetical protein
MSRTIRVQPREAMTATATSRKALEFGLALAWSKITTRRLLERHNACLLLTFTSAASEHRLEGSFPTTSAPRVRGLGGA